MTNILTADDLGKLLRVPKRTIYKFAKEGLIPGAFRVGKHWRFREDLIHKWIYEQTETGSRTVSQVNAIQS
jgi:excisionase family DNA binding protein